MYEDDRNPVFASWTGEAGGGPPCLWADSMLVNENPWQPENVTWLRDALKPARLQEAIRMAAVRLAGHDDVDIVAQMEMEFPERQTLLELRVEQLLAILSTPDHGLSEWVL